MISTGSAALASLPQVTVSLRGEIGRRLKAVTEQWILPAPFANPAMLEMFRNRDRLPYQDQVPWAGEFAGKYLTHAVQILRLTGEPKLRRHVAWFVGELLPLQDADGYLGPWPRPWRLRKGGPTCAEPWDAWGHYHIMLGLLLWHEYAADPQALAAVRRIADLFCSRFLGSATERLHDTGAHEMNQAPAHSLALLYRVTGEQRYLRLAQQIVKEFELPPAGDYLRQGAKNVPFWQTPKPRWESLHPIMGLAELYRATGDRQLREAFENLWWSMLAGDRHNNGGFTSGEKATGNPYDPNPIETCCTVAWTTMSVEMLRLTGSSVVADEIELSLLNSGIGMMSPSGRWVTYNTPMSGQKRASAHDIVFQARPGSPELNCCSVNGPRMLGMIGDWGLMQRADGLAVNYYGPGTFDAPLPAGRHVRLVQQTTYPRGNRIAIRTELDAPAEFVLALRIPHWSEKTRVTVNGAVVANVTPGRYLELRRNWQTGDRVVLLLDFRPHFWCNPVGLGATDLELTWQLFGPAPRPDPDPGRDKAPMLEVAPALEGLTSLPQSLSLNGRAYAPVKAESRRGMLACRELFPEVGGQPVTVGMAEWEVEEAQTLTIYFAADWWCAWYLNGEKLFDNHLYAGNGGDLSVRNNRFTAHLRKGRNLLAFRISGGSKRGCWLSAGRDLTGAERAAVPRTDVRLASVYRGPILLAYDPRYNSGDSEQLPVLDSRRLKLRPVAEPTWLKPWLLCEAATRDGGTLRLCDFGSAGNAGNAYQSWLPVAFPGDVSSDFSPQNPLRSHRP